MATKASGHCSASQTVPACLAFGETTDWCCYVIIIYYLFVLLNKKPLLSSLSVVALCNRDRAVNRPSGWGGGPGTFLGPRSLPFGPPPKKSDDVVSRQTNPASVAKAQGNACVELNLWLAIIDKHNIQNLHRASANNLADLGSRIIS